MAFFLSFFLLYYYYYCFLDVYNSCFEVFVLLFWFLVCHRQYLHLFNSLCWWNNSTLLFAFLMGGVFCCCCCCYKLIISKGILQQPWILILQDWDFILLLFVHLLVYLHGSTISLTFIFCLLSVKQLVPPHKDHTWECTQSGWDGSVSIVLSLSLSYADISVKPTPFSGISSAFKPHQLL